ncbi:hypothetical protein CL628_00635 [bacterium]|nr:hypothetical protein [bacterium]
MKIWLPKRIKPTGGTSSFALKLRAGMEHLGHQVYFKKPAHYDVLLASPRAPYSALLHARFRRRRIVQRLDGVFYPGSSAGVWWRLHNLPLSIIRKYFADSFIYQSEFSQAQCDKFLWSNEATETPSTVIYNGVDTELFSTDGPVEELRDNPDQHVFITWSRFRRPDQIDPLVASFHEYRRQIEANAKLVILGNFVGAVADRPQKHKHDAIEFRGIVPNSDIPRYARGADVFALTHRNPPCPNNVIEAMACGLPICGLADGAMSELVAADAGVLLPVRTRGEGAKSFNTESFAHAMASCITLTRIPRPLLPRRFTLPHMTREYTRALTSS